jgi:hypothetical protein
VLSSSEGALLGAIHYIYNRGVVDVAKTILRKNKVVTRIYVAVMLYHCCVAAIFRHCADARWRTNPIGKCGVEELHEDLTNNVVHPLVEN